MKMATFLPVKRFGNASAAIFITGCWAGLVISAAAWRSAQIAGQAI